MRCNVVRREVKFSYDIIRGSMEKRRSKTEKLSNDIFEMLSQKTENGVIKIDEIANAMKTILPEEKPIKIVQLKKSNLLEGANDYIERDGQFVGQTIELPLKRKLFQSRGIPVYMHELTHVLDILFNPKYTARSISMGKRNLYDTKYSSCFDKTLYRAENYNSLQEKEELLEKRKAEIKHWIAGKSINEKIDCIQESKNMLEMELNAFRAEERYADKMKAAGMDVFDGEFKNESEEFLIEEKIQMLKDLGKEIIKKERLRHSKSLSSDNRAEQAVL